MNFYATQTVALAHPDHGQRIVVQPGDKPRSADDPLVKAYPAVFEQRVLAADVPKTPVKTTVKKKRR